MRMMLLNILAFCFFILSCKIDVQESPPDLNAERMKKKEALISLNKYIASRNKDLIRNFIFRSGWDMINTGSGLWYEVVKPGSGEKVTPGSVIIYSFKLRLLDGTFCDSASAENPKTVRVGRAGVESGLEEAFLLLKEGDSARFIIPPHLAHGLLGDGSKIPSGAVLIYDIHLLRLRND
jgi:FKBP-type peptidyl-prolyl cis-trans isomerase